MAVWVWGVGKCALLLALPILKLSQPLPNPASSFLYNFLFHLCSRQSIRLNRHHCSVLGVKVSQSVTVNQSPHSLRVFIDYFGSSICLSFCSTHRHLLGQHARRSCKRG
ncbi:uncharacterized protein BO96DRAFT_15195 [Aspergillus niger CBS 101883]|uniref:uncharacterized protein n=1 Tax=Aspergillus lacticoffeatus (strain CBS 101883) TaxID=1450533 RepID=UPI000D8021A7|nr:uncharacterized protein BO96DRAFT_15195 [Aspergillus niger CBS 101883]PYH62545.1 hypothetical protein BO96DRAFT_15195 [Aspergillus niger CBS 101883]